MTPRFLVELEAATDLDDAFTWYERRLPGLGSEFTRAVRATFAAIQRQPESYARAHEKFGEHMCGASHMPSIMS